MMKTDGLISLSRTDLYERVWTTPVATLARDFGISDVALAKLCRRRNIPRPPRGYWARVAAGSAPERTPLPAALPHEERPAIFRRIRRSGENASDTWPGRSPFAAARLTANDQRLHPVADRVRKSLLLSKPSPCGRVMVQQRGLPIVFASPRQATKVAELVHTLMSEAERKQIEIRPAPHASEALEFRRGKNSALLVIEEDLRTGLADAASRPPEPSGQLTLKLSIAWKQTADEPVETLLESLLAWMDECLR